MLNVLLAEDAPKIRKLIQLLLRTCKQIRIVGEASTFSETSEKARALAPDVIVLDLGLPDKTSFALNEIAKTLADSRVVALACEGDYEAESLANAIGVSALVEKTRLFQKLIPAILKLSRAHVR